MQLSHRLVWNKNIANLLLIIGVLIFTPFSIFFLESYLFFGFIITIFISPFILKNLQWGIPLLIITTLIPWNTIMISDYVNPSNLVIGLMVGSYLLNPTQLNFQKLIKYKKLCTLILIFIFLDFIATARQVLYTTDEGVVYIFVQFFLKSNFYPIIFLIILCHRNLLEKAKNYFFYIYILLITIMSCIILDQIIFLDYYSSNYLFDTIAKELFDSGKNGFALRCCIAIILCLWIIKNNQTLLIRITTSLFLAICVTAVFYSYSRQAYIYLFIIIIYSLFRSKIKFKYNILAISSIIVTIFVLYFITPHLLQETFSDTFGVETLSEISKGNIRFDRSIRIRSIMYSKQIDYFADNPHFLFIGGGKSHSRLYFTKFRGMYAGEKSMHSAILTIIDNYGLIGFYIFLKIHYLIIKSAINNSRKGELLVLISLVCILSYFFQGHHIFIYHPISLIFWVIAAYTLYESSTKTNRLTISN